jgi:large subunit ribosomal protein L25
MSETSLAVEIREGRGKGTARQLRRAERIPGIVYGSGFASVSVSLDPDELEQLIHKSHAGINTLIDLMGASEVAGKTVLVKELQRDPVRGGLLHADLFEVDPNARIRVSVPIHLEGIAHGVTMGGLIDHSLRTLELDCLPRAIPDDVVVDVSALDVGDTVHVSDIALPEGVELHTPSDLSVVSVVAPVAEEEPVTDEAIEGEAAEGAEAAAAGQDAGEGAASDDADGGNKES